MPRYEGEYPVVDQEAYWKFYHHNFQRVLAWVIRHHWDRVKDVTTATEFTEDAFVDVFQKRHTVRKNPLAVVINRIKDALKQYRKREIPMGSMGLRSDESQMGGQPDPAARTASSVAASKESDQIFNQAGINTLAPGFREPFELARSGMDRREIAKKMGLTPAAVQKRIQTAAHHLVMCIVKFFPEVARNAPGAGREHPIRTYQAARKAIDRLPTPCAQILTLVYAQRFQVEEVWSQAGFSSVEEARVYLVEGLQILEILFEQKMPDDLVSALAR